MYKFFAKYYDKLMGDRSNYVNFINEVIKKYNLNPKNILDIACGTGKILSSLSKNYKKYGIDISEDMLEIAKNNVKDGTFFCQDMKNLDLKNIKFDLVTNLFDSINHLTDFNDWKKVFDSVFEILNDEAIFIFDINTIEKLEKISVSQRVEFHEIDNDFIVFQTGKEADKTRWNIKFFENTEENNYKLLEENIYEKSFEIDKILNSLSKFSKVLVVDENFKKITSETYRVFFICIK